MKQKTPSKSVFDTSALLTSSLVLLQVRSSVLSNQTNSQVECHFKCLFVWSVGRLFVWFVLVCLVCCVCCVCCVCFVCFVCLFWFVWFVWFVLFVCLFVWLVGWLVLYLVGCLFMFVFLFEKTCVEWRKRCPKRRSIVFCLHKNLLKHVLFFAAGLKTNYDCFINLDLFKTVQSGVIPMWTEFISIYATVWLKTMWLGVSSLFCFLFPSLCPHYFRRAPPICREDDAGWTMMNVWGQCMFYIQEIWGALRQKKLDGMGSNNFFFVFCPAIIKKNELIRLNQQ